ncbi:MAG: mechanosensitive ion channel domain-containing protein [Planctomycetota bacterium]
MFRSTAWVAMALFLATGLGFAQDKPSDLVEGSEPLRLAQLRAQTNEKELELKLRPLFADDIKKSADEWVGHLQVVVGAIATRELTVDQINSQPEAAGAESRAEEKTKLLGELTSLRGKQTALVSRVTVVLNALEAKGGDPESYRKFVSAVPGLIPTVEDITDVEGTWNTFKGWLFQPEQGPRWAMNFGKFVAAVVVVFFIAGIIRKIVNKILSMAEGSSSLLKDFLPKMIRRIVVFVGFIYCLGYLGVDTGPFFAVLFSAGIVVALALQGTLSNFASGTLILFYRPFDIGDVIDAAGVSGTVQGLNLMSTQVKTFDNKAVIVPNNEIWNGVITNVTNTDRRRVDMVFGIGYDDDTEKAQRVLEEIVGAHELVMKDPEPTIKLHELADSSVNFVCRPWVKTDDYWAVYWDVTRDVKKRFDAEGLSIPYPQQDVHMHQVGGNG